MPSRRALLIGTGALLAAGGGASVYFLRRRLDRG